MNLGIVIQWLRRKIRRGNNTNPFSAKAAISLRASPNWELRIINYLAIATQLITQRLATNKGSTELGHCKLTEASLAVGKHVINQYPERTEVPNHFECLSVGNYMIGALYYGGYIKLYREEGYSKWNTDAPYIIEILPKFLDLQDEFEVIKKKEKIDEGINCIATEYYKIPDITSMVQKNGRGVIKAYRSEHLDDLDLAIKDRHPWLLSCDKMQQTGWKINTEILKIVNENKVKLLQPIGKRPNKGCPKRLKLALEKLKKKDTQTNRNRYNKEAILWNKELDVLRPMSQNAAIKATLDKANEIQQRLDEGKEAFYQYVELDYRGRAYYHEPFMNYQGTDLARGLMLFTQGKPLGETGKKWLAIHTATCYNESYNINSIPAWCTYDYAGLLQQQGLEDISVDKMTLKDREQWTYENMDKILTHTEELQDCEKPVLYLACCLEWKQYESNPEYISYLPVPIDGSCNGYQHSGAIAKDEITGGLVSLVDQEVQADLYLTVAKALVKKNPAFFAARPTMKMKHIRKGIVKRAVMTRAYSAGIDTMAENMYRDCHTEGYTTQFNINMLDCLKTLAPDVYELCSAVCPGATKTMNFLQDLAKFQLGEWKTYDPDGTEVSPGEKKKRHEILQKSKAGSPDKEKYQLLVNGMESRCVRGNGTDHMMWYTPTLYPVRYYSFHQKRYKYEVSIPSYKKIKHVVLVDREQPHAGDFQAGISPNFIHSMDAAHMAGVIWNWDGPFGAVHDSYSALACDVEKLSELTREIFVDIYDNPDPYKEIAGMILKGDAELDFDLPETGKLEVSDVLTSRYFFS